MFCSFMVGKLNYTTHKATIVPVLILLFYQWFTFFKVLALQVGVKYFDIKIVFA